MTEKTTTQNRQVETALLAKRSVQIQRGTARAAVLGVNDGLVSVLCIVLAVAGAGADNSAVLLAGFAGLLAGAVSMAAGEWISVKAQVELFGGVLNDIRRLMKIDRPLLEAQVEDSLSESGHDKKTANQAAKEIAADDHHLVDMYSKHVMGFNPDELGSPWVAAISSFLLFTLGALAPLTPWFFTGSSLAVWISIVLTAVGGLIVGGYISVTSGRGVVYGALRQLAIIVFASLVTFGVGYMFGVSVA